MQRNYDESYLKKIEKVEPFKIPTEADIEKIRKELNTKEEKCYSDSFICKNLRTKSSLRKVFLGVFK